MASVFVTKRVNVYPKPMQPTKIMKLTNLDRQCPTLMYLVLFYNPCHYHYFNNDHVFSSLKSSLEETLSVWYPAAGRLSKNPNNGNKLDLWCNNGGALMVEAVTHARVSDLGNLSQYNDFFENLAYKPCCINGNISEMPLLVIQVTKFGCGGYSVGIGTSHALFDGKATFNFLSAWASNNTHKHISNQGIYKPLDQWQKPVHERDNLLQLIVTNCSRRSTRTKSNSSAAALPKVEALQHLYQLITQAAPVGGTPMIPQLFVPSLQDNCVLRTFHFTSSMIEALKRSAFGGVNSGYSSSSSCSSFDIVTAHLWKARTKALGLRRERMVCLQYAIDTRSRVTPQLSQSFSGNAYVLASVALTAGELELASHETLVNMIKSAKNSVDSDYVSAYMEALEGSGDALPPLRELTIVSDWTRTPFHKINFNTHPNNKVAVSACPLNPPIPQVAYFMQSPKEDKGIDIRIGLNSQIIASFSHLFLNIS